MKNKYGKLCVNRKNERRDREGINSLKLSPLAFKDWRRHTLKDLGRGCEVSNSLKLSLLYHLGRIFISVMLFFSTHCLEFIG